MLIYRPCGGAVGGGGGGGLRAFKKLCMLDSDQTAPGLKALTLWKLLEFFN